MTDQQVRRTLKEELGPSLPPPPEEIERRRQVVAKILKLRDEVGPIGISVTELLREVREEEPYGDA